MSNVKRAKGANFLAIILPLKWQVPKGPVLKKGGNVRDAEAISEMGVQNSRKKEAGGKYQNVEMKNGTENTSKTAVHYRRENM